MTKFLKFEQLKSKVVNSDKPVNGKKGTYNCQTQEEQKIITSFLNLKLSITEQYEKIMLNLKD